MYIVYYDMGWPDIAVRKNPTAAHLRLNDCQWIVPGTVGVDD